MFNDVKAWAQYRSPWNERLTKIYFPLSGTLTVLNVFDGLVLRAWDFLNSREADFPQGDSRWRWTAQEALARLCFCGGDNVPHSQKPGKCVEKSQSWVQSHPDPHGQEPVDRNDVSTLRTVWCCPHQVEWGKQLENHPICEKKTCARWPPSTCSLPEYGSSVGFNHTSTNRTLHTQHDTCPYTHI